MLKVRGAEQEHRVMLKVRGADRPRTQSDVKGERSRSTKNTE